MKEIGDLAESGARYTEMPHVIEITLPMLCNYLPRWWERGLENFPEQDGNLCTDVTSEQLNQLLGSIMKIVVNNLGIDEASIVCCEDMISFSHFGTGADPEPLNIVRTMRGFTLKQLGLPLLL